MISKEKTRILFVCLGNICRSPLVEGVFRDVVLKNGCSEQFFIDSAGTGGWHCGNAPDQRSVETALNHGIDISRQRARKLVTSDFDKFDLVLVMDHMNMNDAMAVSPPSGHAKIHMFTKFATGEAIEVPDPYYGGEEGFELVYDMVHDVSAQLLKRLVGAK